MNRTIAAFRRDREGDLVAVLDCGHRRHMRHRPPFVNRPWTETESGRRAMLGTAVDCAACDRMEWPDGAAVYRRTPVFDAAEIPRGMTSDHSTRAGVWGRIQVESGALLYRVEAPLERELRIEAPGSAVIVPEVRHRIAADGAVRFFIEFGRVAD